MKAIEPVGAGDLEQQEESQEDAASADVRHDEVQHACAARVVEFVLEAHETVCGQRHDFPGDEEEESVVRQKD
jgi:hypothetical protein